MIVMLKSERVHMAIELREATFKLATAQEPLLCLHLMRMQGALWPALSGVGGATLIIQFESLSHIVQALKRMRGDGCE